MKLSFAHVVGAGFCLVVLSGLSGCLFDSAADKIGKSVENSAKELKAATDALAKAVPGEWWRQLLEDAHSSDEKKREEARRVIASIFNIDPSTQYETTVTFTFDANVGPLSADSRQASDPTEGAVRALIQNTSYNPTVVPSVQVVPLTKTEVRGQAAQRLRETVNGLPVPTSAFSTASSGLPSGPFNNNVYVANLFQSTDSNEGKAVSGSQNAFRETLRLYSDAIANVVSDTYDATRAVPISNTLTRAWHAQSLEPLLFVVIDAKDFERHKGNLTVTASLHEKGNPTAYFDNRGPYKFIPEEWKKASVKRYDGVDFEVYYAAHNMPGWDYLRPEVVQDLDKTKENLNKIVADLNRLANPSPSPTR